MDSCPVVTRGWVAWPVRLANHRRLTAAKNVFKDVMNVGAKTLTDADIDNPDAWCASIKIAAKPGK